MLILVLLAKVAVIVVCPYVYLHVFLICNFSSCLQSMCIFLCSFSLGHFSLGLRRFYFDRYLKNRSGITEWVKRQNRTMQLASHWKALFVHMSCITHLTSSSGVVAGIGMAPRDVISRATSGTQAPVSERRCEASACHTDLKHRHPSCSASQGSYCSHPPCSTNHCESCASGHLAQSCSPRQWHRSDALCR